MIMLPPGFRFHPTDEELVVQYLLCKALSCPLPALIIPEVNVFKYDPWDLPGDNNIGRYFFSTRDVKYSGGIRSNRATGSGYWKATGIDKRIVASKSNQVVGMKKILAFYRGKPPNGSRTDWVMHEYRLVGFETSACIFPQMKNTNQNLTIQREDLVLCCVFLKKGTNYVQRKENKIENPSLMELMMQDKTVPHPSYFCSSSPTSEITEEVSSTEIADHGESSSNYNSASS